MNAFDVGMSSLFADHNLVTQATYYPLHGSRRQVAVVAHMPDVFQVIGESTIATPTLAIDVLLNVGCSNIAPGERFLIDGKTYIVQGEPKRDSSNLTARVQLCES